LPDIPVCAVYIFCYVVAAVCHKTIFLVNMKKKGKKFVMSAMTFGTFLGKSSVSAGTLLITCRLLLR